MYLVPDNLSLDMGDTPNPSDQMNAVSYTQIHVYMTCNAFLAVCGVCKVGKLIPLFVQRAPRTPKVSKMAIALPQGEDPFCTEFS